MKKIQAVCAIIINKNNDFLLIKRARAPYKSCWALISGIGETKKGVILKEAIKGEVECDITTTFFGKQIFTLPVKNDNIVNETVVFLGKVDELNIENNIEFSEEWKWFSIDDISNIGILAFQHNKIIEKFLSDKEKYC